MPVLFVGHGSPSNALADNEFTRGFRALATSLPRPKAILAISAHWFVDATLVTSDTKPRTIHDFSGFPSELYGIEYPASGSIELAERTRDLIGGGRVKLSGDWGLDHGTWSVLKWIYPVADVPVVQLSMDARLSPEGHLALAGSLSPLREERVLIFCSGNVTHSLGAAFRQMRTGDQSVPGWSARFDRVVQETLLRGDARSLLGLWPGAEDARLCHPTPDHWLPLIYAMGVRSAGDRVRFPIEGFDFGLSMRSVLFG